MSDSTPHSLQGYVERRLRWAQDVGHHVRLRDHPDPHHKHILDWRTGETGVGQVEWVSKEDRVDCGGALMSFREFYQANADELGGEYASLDGLNQNPPIEDELDD